VPQEKYHVKNPVVAFLVRRFFERISGVLSQVEPCWGPDAGGRGPDGRVSLSSILDAGCGEGELLRRGVLGAGCSIVSLDRSLEALRSRPPSPGPRPPLVCGSVLELPFARGSFDAVLCLEVLEHLEDPAAAVRELMRVARKAVVLSVPYEPYFRLGNLLRGKYLGGLGNHPEHIQHWNMRRFRRFLEPAASEVPCEIKLVEAFPWIVACCRPKPIL
jgi:SAM-dependent methyltransferase